MTALPYQKTETFELGGKVFQSEEAALRAAIEVEIGNPGYATAILEKACELAPLLARACELKAVAAR